MSYLGLKPRDMAEEGCHTESSSLFRPPVYGGAGSKCKQCRGEQDRDLGEPRMLWCHDDVSVLSNAAVRKGSRSDWCVVCSLVPT